MKHIRKPFVWLWSSFDSNEARGTWVPLTLVVVSGLIGALFGLAYGDHNGTVYILGCTIAAAFIGMVLIIILLSLGMSQTKKKTNSQKQPPQPDSDALEAQ